MTMKLKAIFVIVVIALLFVLSGCGGIGGKAQTACIAFDASHSTRYVEPEYERMLRERVEKVADEGGTVDAIVLTGAPKVEAIVRSEDFSDLTGEEQQGERSRAVSTFTGRVASEARQSLLGRQDPTRGSGIVDGIDLLAEQGGCDSVVALSDGLETSAFHAEHADLGNSAARRRLVERLGKQGLVPALGGDVIFFPLGGVLPQGTNIPAAVLDGLRSFWQEYAVAAGASLAWRGER
jgi:hypothetical protein